MPAVSRPPTATTRRAAGRPPHRGRHGTVPYGSPRPPPTPGRRIGTTRGRQHGPTGMLSPAPTRHPPGLDRPGTGDGSVGGLARSPPTVRSARAGASARRRHRYGDRHGARQRRGRGDGPRRWPIPCVGRCRAAGHPAATDEGGFGGPPSCPLPGRLGWGARGRSATEGRLRRQRTAPGSRHHLGGVAAAGRERRHGRAAASRTAYRTGPAAATVVGREASAGGS